MTDTDTSPEAIQDALKACAAYYVPTHRLAVLHALSAAHAAALVREQDANAKAMQHLRRAEAAEARERALLKSNDQERKVLVENASLRHRLKTAEAERDALKAELAEAVTLLGKLHHAVCGEIGFAECVRRDSRTAYPWPALDIADEDTRAFLARHQKGADT